MVRDAVKVGLLGLGTVGAGVMKILQINSEQIRSRAGINIEVKKILVRDLKKPRAVEVESSLLTTNVTEILEDPEIDVVIELMGGLEARVHVEEALRRKKYVITANKDLMATAGASLLRLARDNGRNIYYEASVGGGIPLIRPLKHSLGANKILRLVGIINGTTNYILTRMDLENMEFNDALAEAQARGFAEQNPENDLEGKDAAYKLSILAGLAFNSQIHFDTVNVEGISNLKQRDILYARELGFTIKLLAIGEERADGLTLRVHPALVPLTHPLAGVLYENNALYVEGNAVGEVMFYGPGAGALPTGSSVVADLIDVARTINHHVENGIIEIAFHDKKVVPLEELESAFYLRLLAEDQSGVFAGLANAFSEERVSLDMIIQKRSREGEAEIVLVTHAEKEKSFNAALASIQKFSGIKAVKSVYRVIRK